MTTRPARAHLTALFILVDTVPAATAIGPGWSSEADALLAWKASLVNTSALSSWTRDAPVCNWTGVICGHRNHVRWVRIEGCGLSGGLGTLDTAALTGLAVLNLKGNNLGGAIPANISQLRSLKLLDLSNNRFDGSIPSQLSDMHSLVSLRLRSNNLLGDIPRLLCSLLSVQVLDLSDNRFTGELPDCWCNLQNLRFIDLSRNRLTGELPGCWWNLQELEFMDLSNNSFSGEIPAAQAGQTCSLWSLYLAGNNFIGAFPPALNRCNLLATLDIGNNMFFGGIPPWIGSQVPSLRILSLRSNNFTGNIPPELSQLSQLQLLDMANNSLAGSIPVAFGNLTSMKNPQGLSTLVVQEGEPTYNDRINVMWKGQKLIFERTLWLLTGVDLSGNFLSGCIPEELTNLQGLQFLNLSRNHLSCGIPQGIGSLNSLESLDLSSNDLWGEIPPSISILSGLSIFNVSHNHLSGKIPAGSQIQTLTDPSIYSDNSGLCGFPLVILCADTSLPPDGINGEGEDQWLYYCVIAGIIMGFWLWFAMLFTVQTWRCGFYFFVDDVQCKFMQKMSH
jgi:Leucine-rich repeat (LRR) protein